MQLLLLRHAKSSWKDAAVADHDRPLNRRGREAASAMGAYIAAQDLIPSLALVSSALRTVETWSRLAAEWPAPPAGKVLRSLYLATPAQLLAQIRRVPATAARLLVLGHNPGLEGLARALAGPDSRPEALRPLIDKYPTGGLAIFDCAIDDWSALQKEGASLRRFVTPRALIGGTDD